MAKRKFKPTLIGRRIKVIMSKNRYNEGMEGYALDETRNMIVLKTKNGIRKLIKNQSNYEIDGKIVDGNSLNGRPEERVKQ